MHHLAHLRSLKFEALSSVVGTCLVFVGLVVFYIAALGPFVSLADRGYVSHKFVRDFYAPLPRCISMRSLRAWAHLDRENFHDVTWEKR
jgi:hypothetical protein